jgi:hypothetical protein
MQLAMSQDPFEKVKDLIKSLITRLQAESAQEQGEQAWCNAHMEENKKDREERSDTVEKNTAKIENLTASIARKEKEVKDAQATVVKLKSDLAEARKIRGEEKTLFAKTKVELETMSTNLEKAINVLEDAGSSFLQQPAFDPTDEYKSRGGDVVALLENLKSQTVSELTEKEADEATANNQFLKAEGDAKVAIKKNETQIDMTKTQIANHKQDKESTQAELTDAQALLDEANQYYESLQEKCVHAVSVEERAKSRAEEIASLEQALAILEGQ